MDVGMSSRKGNVSYFYRHDIGNYYYGPGHPMKPHRLRLTHQLLLTTGLYKKMDVFLPHQASQEEMEAFHAHEYLEFLRKVTPETEFEYEKHLGGSIDAAIRVNHRLSDVCVNWSGGLHHAKKAEASGFCYVNDITLCILELLKYHARILYIDIDIHHGDGVEESFYTTDRVMTCSFHKYGDYFPNSGAYTDVGTKDGKYCSVNFPLKDGLDDQSFESIFKPVISKIMQVYQPGAVVMCCGADSIAGDRIGVWNLSLKGHGMAIEFVKSFGLPVILLGGGGYTPRNVARCWAYETAIGIGVQNDLPNEIPYNDFYNHFGPNYQLHLTPDPSLENLNSKKYLEKYTTILLQNLNYLGGPPSIQFQDVPSDFYSSDSFSRARDEQQDSAEGMEKRTEGISGESDSVAGKKAHANEYYESTKDNDNIATSAQQKQQDSAKMDIESA